ncbi:DinB family protein [Deinococcus planocerae]|uniref:DinB family protein n=1 Tax=Deinococcus planocerae TaxID=1737569 RepID=UPI000C7E895C|nr:DinB family protein [Deinococcus planocerae]
MSPDLLDGPPPETLLLLLGHSEFASPERILGGLDARLAAGHLPGAPHSIAEILAHMQANMLFNLDLIEGREPPPRLDWRAVGEDEWPGLVTAFLETLATLSRHAESPDVLRRVIFPPTATEPGWTAGYKLAVNVAKHNAYHLGQVVTLRQLLSAWN